MTIVNLTPHEINIKTSNGMISIPPSNLPPVRLVEKTETRKTIETSEGEITVSAKYFGEVKNLPSSEEGKVFVVSAIAGTAIWELLPERRKDVFITGEAIRDSAGKHIGCNGLCCYPK
jgi:hypothetical protein